MKEVYSIVCQTNLSPKLFSGQISKKHNCNPFQSSSSLSIRVSFCIRRVIYTVILFRSFFDTGYFCCTRFCGGSHTLNFGTPRDIAPLSLSSNVFERRTSTGNERFSLLMYRDAAKFVLLSVFTLKETFCPRTCSKSRLRSAKNPLPFDVRRSKMPLLKPHNNWHLDSIRGYTPRSLRCTTRGGGCCPRAFLLLVMWIGGGGGGGADTGWISAGIPRNLGPVHCGGSIGGGLRVGPWDDWLGWWRGRVVIGTGFTTGVDWGSGA